MGNKHEKGCECPICNNEIREERQYAAWQIMEDKFIIIDAVELAHIDAYFEDKNNVSDIENKKQPQYPKIEPEENKKPVLAYGVIIPQYDYEVRNWNDELEKFKGYAFGTLMDEKIYLSAYRDLKLFPEKIVYESNIPCALLLDTALDFSEEREYGFGYTAFLIYSNVEIFDNILRRKFLFCFGEIEDKFNDKDIENWTKYIDTEKIMKIAQRLF